MVLTNFMSTNDIIQELGRRLKDLRLADNMTRAELSERSGVSKATIARLESGENCSLECFLAVLKVFGLIDPLGNVIPEQDWRPSEMISQTPRRQRASRKSKADDIDWKWGDES